MKKKIISIATIGIVLCGSLIFTGYYIEAASETPDYRSFIETIVLGILASIFASLVFIVIESLFSDDRYNVIEEQLKVVENKLRSSDNLYDCGIIQMKPKKYFDEEKAFWTGILSGNLECLELMGNSLSNWFKPFYKDVFSTVVKFLIEHNKPVKIVFLSCDIAYDKIKKAVDESHVSNTLSKTEKTICNLYNLLKDYDDYQKKCLEIYFVNPTYVKYFFIHTGKRCIVSPYISEDSTNKNVFVLELDINKEYGKHYIDNFNTIIDSEHSVQVNIFEKINSIDRSENHEVGPII